MNARYNSDITYVVIRDDDMYIDMYIDTYAYGTYTCDALDTTAFSATLKMFFDDTHTGETRDTSSMTRKQITPVTTCTSITICVSLPSGDVEGRIDEYM